MRPDRVKDPPVDAAADLQEGTDVQFEQARAMRGVELRKILPWHDREKDRVVLSGLGCGKTGNTVRELGHNGFCALARRGPVRKPPQVPQFATDGATSQ